MSTILTVMIEGKKKIRYDVFDINDLTDMRRYVKAMERCKKNGFTFDVYSVVTKKD